MILVLGSATHVVSRPSLHGHPFFILCLFPFSLSTGFFSLLSNCVLSWLSCDDFSASSSFALVLPSHPNSRKLFSEIFPRLPYLAFCLSPCLAFILTVHTLPTLVKDIRNFHCQTMSPHHCSLRRDSSGCLFHSCSFICLFVCLFSNQSHTEIGGEHREIDVLSAASLTRWLHWPALGQHRSQVFHSGSHMGGRVPNTWVILYYFSQAISRDGSEME